MGRGLTESKAVELINKAKKSESGRSILKRKFRNQTIAGIIILVLGFLIISGFEEEGKSTPLIITLFVLFGLIFSIRGGFVWIRYKIQNR